MSLVGEVVHNIRMVELLGEGGMGEVYLGVDEVLGRQVAVKAIRADRRPDAKAKGRFLREAQVLSQLDHPKICRIYEYIESPEHELIVLELVRGENLGQVQKRGLAPRYKQDVAEQIAEALVAAHSMSVVHRDLKPENIMISPEGLVKVLDFGLARPLSGSDAEGVYEADVPDGRRITLFGSQASGDGTHDSTGPSPSEPSHATVSAAATEHGEVMGTPAFMSPEQARAVEVTAASDMYSFGLLLQVLFTDRPAYADGPMHAIINRAMWGETLQATGLDPELEALIEDLKAFKPGDRPSATEALARLRRVSNRPKRRRRRVLVAAVWSVLLLSTGGMAVQSLRAAREARRAESEVESTRQVADFLVQLFEVSDPGEARGSTITARELLDAGASRVKRELEGQPKVRARLLHAIGTVYHQLGLYQQAESLLGQALQDLEGSDDVAGLELAEALDALAAVLRTRGAYAEAELLYLRSLALYEADGEAVDVAMLATSVGGLYHSMGRYPEARVQLERAVALLDEHLEVEDQRASDAYHNLGVMLRDLGEYEESEVALRRALAIDERVFGPDHHLVASSLESLAGVLVQRDETDEALPLVERARFIYVRSLGPGHQREADCLNTLAVLYWNQGEVAQAEAHAGQALAIYRDSLGEDHPFVGDLLGNLGGFIASQGRAEEALETLERSLLILEPSLGPNHPRVAVSLHFQAVALHDLGRHEEAEAKITRAIKIREDQLGPTNALVALSLDLHALILRATGRLHEAEQVEARAAMIRADNPD